MSYIINVDVAEKIATNVTPDVHIICGNSDYTIRAVFDPEWQAEPNRVARFLYYKDGRAQFKESAFTGNNVSVPILSGIDYVLVGFYAGDLRTTTPAKVLCDRSILCGDAEEVLTEQEKQTLLEQIAEIMPEDGKDGADGADGKSAYELAVENGYTGTEAEWLASLKGEPGEKGDPGEKGEPGDTGPAGEAGAAGVSPTVEVVKMNRQHEPPLYTMTATNADGTTSSVSWEDGADGYTPVKGTDYFTETEKIEMVEGVLAALPVYEGEWHYGD